MSPISLASCLSGCERSEVGVRSRRFAFPSRSRHSPVSSRERCPRAVRPRRVGGPRLGPRAVVWIGGGYSIVYGVTGRAYVPLSLHNSAYTLRVQ